MRPSVLRGRHFCCLLTGSIFPPYFLSYHLNFFTYPLCSLSGNGPTPILEVGSDGFWLNWVSSLSWGSFCPRMVQSGCTLHHCREPGTWAPSRPWQGVPWRREAGWGGCLELGQRLFSWPNPRQTPLRPTRPYPEHLLKSPVLTRILIQVIENPSPSIFDHPQYLIRFLMSPSLRWYVITLAYLQQESCQAGLDRIPLSPDVFS